MPFQIGETQAHRAVGERKKTSVADLSVNIRKGSIYFRRVSNDSSKLSVGFVYDSTAALQVSVYVTAKDRSDWSKLK